MAGTRHWITVLVIARAGLIAVYSILSRFTGHIAIGAIEACITEALSSDNMTHAIIAVTAVVLAVLTICAVGAAHLTPVSDPARVTVGALAVDGVTVMSVLTGRTHLLAVLTKEAFRTELIAACPIPASVTSDATPLFHLTRLLAFAVSTSVPAVLTIETCWTWLSTELAAVPRCAGTRAIRRVALAVDALTVTLTAGPPEPLPTLTSPGELLAGRVVTVALDRTVSAHPARVTGAAARHGVTH